MTDPMPRKDVELPPRMPEAAIIAELRAELAQARADAQAAVALVVERAAEIARVRAEQHADMALNGLPENARLREAMEAAFTDMRWAIRALAPADSLAAVEALRAERDRFEDALHTALVENVDNIARLAAAKPREAKLREALRPFAEEAGNWPDEWPDTADNIESVRLDLTAGHFRAARAALGDAP